MEHNWIHLKPVDPETLQFYREQFHQAVQNVSAVGRKFLPKIDHDQNAVLYWVPDYWRMAGKWVEGSIQFRSSISFVDLCVHLVDNNIKDMATTEISNKTHNQIMIWLEEQISNLGLKSVDLSMTLPYDLPEYPTQKGEKFAPMEVDEAKQLGLYYHNSYVVLNKLTRNYKQVGQPKIWPHHFDQAIAILVKDSGDPETSTYINAGMSPGDEFYDRPYFYVSSWPYPDEAMLKPFDELGIWRCDEWVGAVLLCDELWEKQNQEELVRSFYTHGIENLLSIFMN